MGKLFILLTALFFSAPALASDQPLTLDQQVPFVKGYLKDIHHPRLILGVGNVPELNGNPGFNPFLGNPNDILANDEHKPGVLVNRSLTMDFNDLAQLNKLAEVFADTFAVITADFLVTKYASWTKDHLDAFKRMLKPGGLFIVPLDSNFDHSIVIKADTVEDLFKQASAKEGVQNSTNLLLSGTKWLFMQLPSNLDIPIDPQTQQEIDRKVEEYKKARPLVNDWLKQGRPKSRAALGPLKEEFSKIGVNPDLAGMFMLMSPDTLNDDQRLTSYARTQIMAPKKAVVQNELSDKFMGEYVIPLNLKKIVAEVFNPQQIIIKKNMALPQPHRQDTFAEYSISATK